MLIISDKGISVNHNVSELLCVPFHTNICDQTLPVCGRQIEYVEMKQDVCNLKLWNNKGSFSQQFDSWVYDHMQCCVSVYDHM
jgi:hypothetical protein